MRLFLALLLALPACTVARGQAVTHPEDHLGRPVGVDFELADWNEVSSYFRRLGDESPRAITTSAGTTTEGRDFLVTVVSSEANLARLDEIRAHARVLAQPHEATEAQRDAAIRDGRVILFVSCAMHSTETAGAQFGMEFAHALATSDEEPWKSARDEVVAVIYTTNPDGVDHVTNWYRETVGTPHEAASLLRLYQLYAGHDNNRDWFMLTQSETRIVTRMLYSEWYPQVYWDVHQQGSSGERFFVPPFRDPLNPNLAPEIITGIDAIGSRALMDMTREGLTGISTGVSYDMWWNGGNRNVPVRHNIIGLLTEAASVRIASPIFLPLSDLRAPGDLAHYGPSNQFPAPWPGGWWRLRDIIDYEMSFGRSILGSLVREPDFWRRNAMDAALRTVDRGATEAPRAWIIPSDDRDPEAVARLVDTLLLGGVAIDVATEDFTVDGRPLPAGSIVIRRDQPYGAHVKDLMEVQRYPQGKPPYDVAGWTLPALLGVHRIESIEPVDPSILERVDTPAEAVRAFRGDERADGSATRSLRHMESWTALAAHLAEGGAATVVTRGPDAGLARLDGTGEGFAIDDLPRIGLYAPWRGVMNEGWMRWVLDHWSIPYTRVRNETVRAGRLHDVVDVLILPSISGRAIDAGRAPGSIPTPYERGLDPEGAIAIEEFVRAGGTLIAMEASSTWAIDLLRLPLVEITRSDEGEGFSCPGSVVRTVPEPTPFTADLPASLAVFFSSSRAFRPMTDAERAEASLDDGVALTPLLRYAPRRVLLSGWIEEPSVIENRLAWVRATYGAGRVHLFGFRPQYRGWSQAAFPLVLRAAFLDGGE